jgi:hypothetical protein
MEKENTAENFFISFFDQKLQFTYPYASIKNIHSKLQLSALGEHSSLQKMKFINYFILFWVIFALLDPDPDCES